MKLHIFIAIFISINRALNVMALFKTQSKKSPLKYARKLLPKEHLLVFCAHLLSTQKSYNFKHKSKVSHALFASKVAQNYQKYTNV